MSLKRRNGIACCLLLLAAICWTFGYRMVQRVPGKSGIVATSYPPTHVSATEATSYSTTIPATLPTDKQTAPDTPSETTPGSEKAETSNGGSKFLGFLLCFAAAAFAGIAVVGFWQTAPILGPDGVSMLAAIGNTAYDTLQNIKQVLLHSFYCELDNALGVFTFGEAKSHGGILVIPDIDSEFFEGLYRILCPVQMKKTSRFWGQPAEIIQHSY